MELSDYLLDIDKVDWSFFKRLNWLLPDEVDVWIANRFGELFLIYSQGDVNRLSTWVGNVSKLSESRDHFAEQMDIETNFRDWFRADLVDEANQKGMILGDDQCYRFKVPPVLGGKYSIENVFVGSIAEHFAFGCDLMRQLKYVPDGQKVRIKLVD